MTIDPSPFPWMGPYHTQWTLSSVGHRIAHAPVAVPATIPIMHQITYTVSSARVLIFIR